MAAKPRLHFSPEELKHNPFGNLLANDRPPSEPPSEPRAERPTDNETAPVPELGGLVFAGKNAKAKIVLRCERKGRGGKKATIVELPFLQAQECERICGEMRNRLGCGGSVENETIVLAGDQMARAEAWLREQGALKVIRGTS